MIDSMTLAVALAFAGVVVALLGLSMSIARAQRPRVTKHGAALGSDGGLVMFVVGMITVICSLGAAAFVLLTV